MQQYLERTKEVVLNKQQVIQQLLTVNQIPPKAVIVMWQIYSNNIIWKMRKTSADFKRQGPYDMDLMISSIQ